MINRQGLLKLVCDQFSNLNVQSFQTRILLQKTIFILQEIGLNLGYDYNWYLRGPYSPQLTADAFEIQNDVALFQEEAGKYKLTDTATSVIARVHAIIGEKINDDTFMELVASLVFLSKYYRRNDEDLIVLLKNKKPKFNDDLYIREGLSVVKALTH